MNALDWIALCQRRGYFVPSKQWIDKLTSAQLYAAYLLEAGNFPDTHNVFGKQISRFYKSARTGASRYYRMGAVPPANPIVIERYSVADWVQLCENRRYYTLERRHQVWLSSRYLYNEYLKTAGVRVVTNFDEFVDYLRVRLDSRENNIGTVSFKMWGDRSHTLDDVRSWVVNCCKQQYFLDDKEWHAVIKASTLYNLYYMSSAGYQPVQLNSFCVYLSKIFTRIKKPDGLYFGLGMSPPLKLPEITGSIDSVDSVTEWLDMCAARGYYLPDEKWHSTIGATILYNAYRNELHGDMPETQAMFGRYLAGRFEKRITSQGIVYYFGENSPAYADLNKEAQALYEKLTQETRDHLTQGIDINEAVKWYAMLNPPCQSVTCVTN